MKLNEMLKKLRLNNNLTQKEVAELLKMNRASYTKYELGTREPDIENLIKLANYFGLTIDDLVGNKKEIEINQPKIINNKPIYKSEIHKELINIINELEEPYLYMAKGYIESLNQKQQETNHKKRKIN